MNYLEMLQAVPARRQPLLKIPDNIPMGKWLWMSAGVQTGFFPIIGRPPKGLRGQPVRRSGRRIIPGGPSLIGMD